MILVGSIFDALEGRAEEDGFIGDPLLLLLVLGFRHPSLRDLSSLDLPSLDLSYSPPRSWESSRPDVE